MLLSRLAWYAALHRRFIPTGGSPWGVPAQDGGGGKRRRTQTRRTRLFMAGKRRLIPAATLLAAGASLAACDAPVGVSPDLQGTYWQKALVTNPNGGGPQVVRWGPPPNINRALRSSASRRGLISSLA